MSKWLGAGRLPLVTGKGVEVSVGHIRARDRRRHFQTQGGTQKSKGRSQWFLRKMAVWSHEPEERTKA